MAKGLLNKYQQDIIKHYVKQAEADFEKCARETNNIMFEEANKIYRSLIDLFYSYETKYYVRHWQSRPGTKTGVSLYYANFIRKDTKHPKLHVDFNASVIEALFKNEDSVEFTYDIHSPAEILDYIFDGWRYAGMSWTAEYHDDLFNGGTGTINQIIAGKTNRFAQQWDKMSSQTFYSLWDKYVARWI